MTSSDLHARASALFLELRDLPAEEREAELERVARGDELLREEVVSLLAHDDDEPLVTVPSFADPPERIGPYRIVERIGRGGSGQVFLAEQEEPLRRRVAIKIVPQAAVDPELAARFEVERRALERTDHPNIARVLDAGRTPAGLPYLVMDYIEGTTITAHCERSAVPLVERIRLMLTVADAVQHAHQRGVIHRDIKPANVLVSETDGRAVPRVLDFGIAKPVAGRFEPETPPTSGLPIGTPSYMAPEQTGTGPVDTRADVYALGALLYELVAGQPPIPSGGDPLAALARIREDVPPPASRRRPGDPFRARIGRSFLEDLDCILARALEKAPERRYASVDALVDDLERLLHREPIEARPPTVLYRVARFTQRNRVLVAALVAVTAALVIGVLGLSAGLSEAQRQRGVALDERNAQEEINRFLTEDLLAAASPDRQGVNATVLDVLRLASEHVDERFPERPLIAATIHHTLGQAFAELAAFADAERHLDRAIALRRDAGGIDAPETVHSELAAASLLVRRERYAEGAEAFAPLIPRARSILGPDDPELYTALSDLGVALESLGRLDEAADSFHEALAGRTRLFGRRHNEVVVTMGNLSFVHDGRGEVDEAIDIQLEALEIAESLEDPPRNTLLSLNNNIGATYQDMGRDAEAAPYLRRAALIADEVLGPEHPSTLMIQGNLAALEETLGESSGSTEIYRNLVEQRTKLLGPDAQDTLTARYGYWNSLWAGGRYDEAAEGFDELLLDVAGVLGDTHWLTAQTMSALARCYLDGDRPEDALPLAEEAEAILTEIYGPDHYRTTSARDVAAAARAQMGED